MSETTTTATVERLIEDLIEAAARAGRASVIITFSPSGLTEARAELMAWLGELRHDRAVATAEAADWKRAAHEAHEEELAATRALDVERAKVTEARALLESLTADEGMAATRCNAITALLAKWDTSPTLPTVWLREVLAVVQEQPIFHTQPGLVIEEAVRAVEGQRRLKDEIVRRLVERFGEAK